MSAEIFPHMSLESCLQTISPYQSASWTASLTLYLNFSTSSSDLSFSSLFVEHFQWNFILVCSGVQDVCTDNSQAE